MLNAEDDNAAVPTGPGALADSFKDRFGEYPDGIWRAPGRVNLIGEHTDYNSGLAIPFAIERATFVAARRRPDHSVRIWSDIARSEVTGAIADLDPGSARSWPGWARYPLGVLWALNDPQPGHGADALSIGVPGFDMTIVTELPLGSGLSSSAALTVAVSLAANDLAHGQLSRGQLARASQLAESEFAGAPCGLMDQLAVLESEAGQGVLIDFLTMGTELVPLDIGPLVVINTRVERNNAGGDYARRRWACEEAAAALGVKSLRQADLAQVAGLPQGEPARRARHVVTENARVAETVARLRSGLPIGDILLASHASLRDDFEVSCPQLDLAVATAMATGAEGARLTGAGLGGCAISLGLRAEALAGPMQTAFGDAGFTLPEVFVVLPSVGARRLA